MKYGPKTAYIRKLITEFPHGDDCKGVRLTFVHKIQNGETIEGVLCDGCRSVKPLPPVDRGWEEAWVSAYCDLKADR